MLTGPSGSQGYVSCNDAGVGDKVHVPPRRCLGWIVDMCGGGGEVTGAHADSHAALLQLGVCLLPAGSRYEEFGWY